jgi:hypothetical protein
MSRKIALGFQIGTELDFAWANDLEGAGSGNITGFAWFQGRLCLGHASAGVYQAHVTDLVPSGYLATGFARFGTLEPKFFDSIRVTADCTFGSIDLATVVTTETPSSLTNVADFNGSRDVSIVLAGDGRADRLSVVFTLNRESGDITEGPVFRSYQIRALPAPMRRQRLIRYPLSLFDVEKDRWGNPMGGIGFAWQRLQVLEMLEGTGKPVLVQDFRTNEAHLCVVESVTHEGPTNPSRHEKNFGGRVTLTVRTVD